MRSAGSEWCRRLCFVVTGQGDCAEQFRALAAQPGFPHVEFCGRTTDAEYAAILQRTHVGLALKPSAGLLAHSPFPSKVVELASAGLLVVSTAISDVRLVLGAGAVYLEDERPAALVAILRSVVEQRSWAAAVAAAGQDAAAQRCAPKSPVRCWPAFSPRASLEPRKGHRRVAARAHGPHGVHAFGVRARG